MANTMQHQNTHIENYFEDFKKFIVEFNLYDVENRIKSFYECTSIKELTTNEDDDGVLKQELAVSGFYYNNKTFKIKCFSCDFILILKKGESAIAKHALEKPQCHFLTSILHDKPKMIMYMSLKKRIESFRYWPIALKQNIEEMARAGLIYTGMADKTQCFFCGSILRNWEENDDPFVEHAYWIPTCQFIIQTKGIDFIKTARQSREELMEKRRRPLIEEKYTDEKFTLSNKMICEVCCEKPRSVCFEPCGHISVCGSCSFNFNNCPVCRANIFDIVRINLD